MAVETLTANTLVADSGTVLSFSGGTFDIGDLKDGNQSTGLTIGSNDAFIDFSISNLVASSIVEALFNVTVVTNGVNEKNLIVITALDQTTNFFLNPSGTGTFTIDITSLGANRIANTNFRLTAAQAITNISEISFTVTSPGKVTLNSGLIKIESGKVTI